MAEDTTRTDITLLGAVIIGGGVAALLVLAAIDLVLMLSGG
jgi:hypothetical protein